MIGDRRRHTAIAGLLGSLIVLTAAGCGAAPPPPNPVPASPAPPLSRLPPRPTELRLDRVQPCALLTQAQTHQLGVDAGEPSVDTDSAHSAVCLWSNNLDVPDTAYLARLYATQSADYALASETGAQVVTIDGFPTVQTAAGGDDPRTHCLLFVDVAQGQSLSVLYVNMAGDYPGINHDVACRLARDAAGLMVTNLRTLAQ